MQCFRFHNHTFSLKEYHVKLCQRPFSNREIEGYEYDKLIEIMNNEVKQVDIWLQAIGLVINQERTHYMVFHRARIKTNSNKISIRDNTIPRVSSTKFLGLIIDD